VSPFDVAENLDCPTPSVDSMIVTASTMFFIGLLNDAIWVDSEICFGSAFEQQEEREGFDRAASVVIKVADKVTHAIRGFDLVVTTASGSFVRQRDSIAVHVSSKAYTIEGESYRAPIGQRLDSLVDVFLCHLDSYFYHDASINSKTHPVGYVKEKMWSVRADLNDHKR